MCVRITELEDVLVRHTLWFWKTWRGLGVSIASRLPGDASAACLHTTVGEPRLWNVPYFRFDCFLRIKFKLNICGKCTSQGHGRFPLHHAKRHIASVCPMICDAHCRLLIEMVFASSPLKQYLPPVVINKLSLRLHEYLGPQQFSPINQLLVRGAGIKPSWVIISSWQHCLLCN